MRRITYIVFLFMILMAAGANASDKSASGSTRLDYASQSLELEFTQTASDSSEIIDLENASQTASMSAPLPERVEFPVNPWTGKNAVFLDKFLAQNWYIEAKVRDFSKLALGIIVAETEDRKFRAETELLVRNPGYRQVYSALIIFPRLLEEKVSLLKKAGITTAKRINKRSLSPENGIDKLYWLICQQLDELEQFEALTSSIKDFHEEFTTLNRRKTRLSELHNLIKTQNGQILETIYTHLQRFEIVLNRYRFKLEDLKTKTAYLKKSNNISRVPASARVAELFRQCDQILHNLDNYKKSTLDFTVKLKNLLVAGIKKMENYASKVEQNRFHINESIGKFPQRDRNLQKTQKFSYYFSLEKIFASNCNLFNQLKELQLIEREMMNSETFKEYLVAFDGNIVNFTDYNDLFDQLYNPDLILKPVIEEIKKDNNNDKGQK